MRIAYILPVVLDEHLTEGGHSQQFHLINGLLRFGHHVTLFARSNDSLLVRSNDAENWQSQDLKWTDTWVFNKFAGATWKTQKLFGVPYLNVFQNVRMLEACVRYLPQCDLCFERVGMYSVAPALASRRIGMPHILFFDADILFELDYAGTPLTGIQRKVASWMQKTSLRKADSIICVSKVSRDHLVSHWQIDTQKVHVLPNAVDIRQFHPLTMEETAEVRREFGFQEDMIVIMFVGSFQPWHDWKGLIQAFQLAKAEASRLQLVFVGDGPQLADAKTLVQSLGLIDQIVFLGAVAHARVNTILGAADIVAAPYPKDQHDFWGSPMKIFEYMASGRAIVAASVGQLAQLLQNEVTALLYEPGDVQAFANHIIALYNAPAFRNEIGRQAREQAVREHSWDTYIEQLDAIISNVVATKAVKS